MNGEQLTQPLGQGAASLTGGGRYALRSHGILRRHDTLLFWIQTMTDSVIALGSLYFVVMLRGLEFGVHYRGLAVLALLLMWIYYNNLGVYRRYTGSYGAMIRLAKGWGWVILSLLIIGFVTKLSVVYSRQVILTWSVFGLVGQVAAHMAIPVILKKFNVFEKNKKPALLVGVSGVSEFLAKHINDNPWLPVKIVGVVNEDGVSADNWNVEGIPVLGNTNDIDTLLKRHDIESVYITMPISHSEMVKKLYLDLLVKNVDVNWVPDMFDMVLVNHNIKEIGGVPILALSETPLLGTRQFTKAVLDKVLASVALIVFSPTMIIAALAIKLTGHGPIIFKQKRHGWNGEEFEVYKFRSMKHHEEPERVVTQATANDSRVTPVGRFLRRSSIDELPQLFNVLEGKMSLAGPRPHALEHDTYYSEKIGPYFARHRIKPGITGLAQVNGYRGETDTIEKMEGRVKYDLEYINNWSIMLDIKILLKTIVVLFSKNAY